MDPIAAAKEAVANAHAMLITAGAGMGVDSGLPDFRGNEGFWNAYPPLAGLGLSFSSMASPRWFNDEPGLAWGFYGHRLGLYRDTTPHNGFKLLLEAAIRMQQGYFVVTSNVDGQFQKAGFDCSRILEMHGSIHDLQCQVPCHQGTWSADTLELDVNLEECRATSELPTCPRCAEVARPNILMFGDGQWISQRSTQQNEAFEDWMDSLRCKRLVILECGAGTAIPTIRWVSGNAGRNTNATFIRINPREAEVVSGQISIPTGALDGISRILQERG